YAVNTATWTLPSNPHSYSGDYTNIELWLHGLAAALEGGGGGGASPTMVGHWAFDEGSGTSTADSSGNGNTGTLSPAPAWTTGQIGGALNFDGSDDAVNAGAGSSLANLVSQGAGGMTIAAWIKADTLG